MPDDAPHTRRDFVRRSALAAAAFGAFGCRPIESQPGARGADEVGRLRARPVASATRRAPSPGLTTLDAGVPQEVLLYVPNGATAERPLPLAVALHGAGQHPRTGIAPLMAHADAAGLLLVAPQSVDATWDFVRGTYGPDVANLDRVLARVFRDFAVDPARVALTGFSDGASYALSLGVSNGDLFTRVVAFSPGILAPVAYRGRPPIFISHGTRDRILDIDRCSRRFVPSLRAEGYTVTYREFDGPHTVPPDVAAEAADFVRR